MKREDSPNALVNLYRTGDGRFLFLLLLMDERDWPRLAPAIGRPELLADPRFATKPLRTQNASLLYAEIAKTLASRPFAEWRDLLDRNDLTFGAMALTSEAQGRSADDRQRALPRAARRRRRRPAHGVEPDLARGRGEGRAAARARDRAAHGRRAARAGLHGAGDRRHARHRRDRASELSDVRRLTRDDGAGTRDRFRRRFCCAALPARPTRARCSRSCATAASPIA